MAPDCPDNHQCGADNDGDDAAGDVQKSQQGNAHQGGNADSGNIRTAKQPIQPGQRGNEQYQRSDIDGDAKFAPDTEFEHIRMPGQGFARGSGCIAEQSQSAETDGG